MHERHGQGEWRARGADMLAGAGSPARSGGSSGRAKGRVATMVQKAGPRMRPCLWTWTGCLLPGVRRTHRGALAPHPKGTCREQGVDKAGGGPAQLLLMDEAPAHLEQAGSRAGCSRPLARHRRLEVGRARRLRLAVHWPPCRVRGLRHATRRGSRRRRTGPRRPGDIADAVAGVLRRGLGPVLQDADHDGDARGVPGERLDADRMRQQDQPIDRGAGDLLAARQAEGGHDFRPPTSAPSSPRR